MESILQDLYGDSYTSGTDNYVVLGNNVHYHNGNKYMVMMKCSNGANFLLRIVDGAETGHGSHNIYRSTSYY